MRYLARMCVVCGLWPALALVMTSCAEHGQAPKSETGSATVQALPATLPAQAAVGRDLNTGQTYAIRAPLNGPPPKDWVDKATGHRVVRLSDEADSQSLYFNVSSYSPDGKKMAYFSPSGIYQVDLRTIASGKPTSELILKAKSVVDGKTIQSNMMAVGKKTGRIFFTRTVSADQTGGADRQATGPVSQDRGSAERSVWWIDPVTKEEHKIGVIPPNYNLATINADETLLGGAVTYLDGRNGAPKQQVRAQPGQRINLAARWNQHLPMELLTMDTATGELKTFNPSNDWDNHFLFSPTDPHLLMYCHEGPWQNNDRVWLINVTDGSAAWKPHNRTMINEIWGHEFWENDGKMCWYQLDLPRNQGSTAWIAGTNVYTHQQIWYHLNPGEGSIHVNISPDGKQFAGDGGNGNPWIMIHHPNLARNLAQGVYDAKDLIQPGWLVTERLVNMENHNYQLEPNVSFTPDMKWIVFRSNMFGHSYPFAVEIAKAKTSG